MKNGLIREQIRRALPRTIVDIITSILYRNKTLTIYDAYRRYAAQKKSIEIGGPSEIFRTVLPVYLDVESLDGVNFGTNTVWEGAIRPGHTYQYYMNRHGQQLISDATDLSGIGTETYECILSSNCLEHIANPLKALEEWKRVLKPGGAMIIVLPNKDSNFDHNRPFTAFEHIIDDAANNIGEDDLTHFDEILSLHDIEMDPPAKNLEFFRARSLSNCQNRTLHHHVFDATLITRMLDHLGLKVVDVTTTPSDFFALATKDFATPMVK